MYKKKNVVLHFEVGESNGNYSHCYLIYLTNYWTWMIPIWTWRTTKFIFRKKWVFSFKHHVNSSNSWVDINVKAEYVNVMAHMKVKGSSCMSFGFMVWNQWMLPVHQVDVYVWYPTKQKLCKYNKMAATSMDSKMDMMQHVNWYHGKKLWSAWISFGQPRWWVDLEPTQKRMHEPWTFFSFSVSARKCNLLISLIKQVLWKKSPWHHHKLFSLDWNGAMLMVFSSIMIKTTTWD